MIQFFTKIINENQIDEFSKMVIVNDISNKFPDGFNYSNHINFIFPDWPLRFQNKEFKNHLNSVVQEYIPAHLTYDIFYLDVNQIDQFEQTYSKWKRLKNTSRMDQVDSKSLQLIQLLMQYKRDEE
jgi:predicted lipase